MFQLAVASLDACEHLVESLREHAELVTTDPLRAGAVVLVALYLGCGARQAAHGARDPAPDQPGQQNGGQQHTGGKGGACGQRALGHRQPSQRDRFHPGVQFALEDTQLLDLLAL